jgi:hypothetical protein
VSSPAGEAERISFNFFLFFSFPLGPQPALEHLQVAFAFCGTSHGWGISKSFWFRGTAQQHLQGVSVHTDWHTHTHKGIGIIIWSFCFGHLFFSFWEGQSVC